MESKRKHFYKEVMGIGFFILLIALTVLSASRFINTRFNDILFPNNNSVFETFKVYFTSITVLVVIEYLIVFELPNNYLFSRALGALTMMITTLLAYGIYFLLNGPHNNTFFILLVYVFSIGFGQYISFLMQRRSVVRWSYILGFTNYFAIAIMIIALTLAKPSGFLFDWYL